MRIHRSIPLAMGSATSSLVDGLDTERDVAGFKMPGAWPDTQPEDPPVQVWDVCRIGLPSDGTLNLRQRVFFEDMIASNQWGLYVFLTLTRDSIHFFYW